MPTIAQHAAAVDAALNTLAAASANLTAACDAKARTVAPHQSARRTTLQRSRAHILAAANAAISDTATWPTLATTYASEQE